MSEYQLLERLEKKYHYFQKIGSGGFSEVYFALQKTTNSPVALKIMDTSKKELKLTFKKEAKILSKLSHPNISTLIEYKNYKASSTVSYGVFTLEKMDMDLLSLILMHDTIPEQEMKKIFRKICAGVLYCHQKGVAHLDLKPDNVLLLFDQDDEGSKAIDKVQVCDFGFAAKWDLKKNRNGITTWSQTRIGTTEYRAPELHELRPKVSFEKADVWSLGVILFSAITGCFPMLFEDGVVISHVDHKVIKQFTQGNECYNLITQLLNDNFEERPTVAEILNHPWLKL